MAPYGITDAVIDFQQANPSYSVELIEGEGDRRTKALLEELYAAVVRGLSLAEAMLHLSGKTARLGGHFYACFYPPAGNL